MAPEFNDDAGERVLLFCDKGASEDFIGGDKVDEDEDDTDEASDLEVVEEVEVEGVGVRDGEEPISVFVTVVVDFNEMLVRLLDWRVVEGEGVGVEASGRI